MKLTVSLLLVCVLQLSASVYSQNAKLSIQFKNGTVKEVLKKIEDQSDYRFFYNEQFIDLDRKINLASDKRTINSVLDEIFEGANVSYKIMENNLIIITPVEGVQQKIKLSGKVTDTAGQPLPGVTVVVKGTTKGVITDFDGNYSLYDIQGNATLVFSFVGMATQEIPVSGKSVINVILAEESIGLDEVVAIGYGTMKKSDLTGSVASVKSERLEMVPNTNFAQAIQGSIPGVTVTTNSAGAEQDGISILLRGRNSITANNSPLVILDGVPFSGNISEISPNDIESIEVLKDASSVAIYGSRGSNGVILITTRMGKKGKATVSYDGTYGFAFAANVPELMDGEEFYEFKKLREPRSMTSDEEEIYQSGNWVDWQDEALQTGHRQQHSLSASGGNENVKFYISGTVLDIEGIALNDNFKRYSLRNNFDIKITDWFSLGTNTQLALADRSGLSPNFGDAFYAIPLATAYDEDGMVTFYPHQSVDPTRANPLLPIYADNDDKTYSVFSNNYIAVNIPNIPGLTYRLNTGVEFKLNDESTYYNRYETVEGSTKQGVSSIGKSLRNSYTIENIVNYNREFNKHKVFLTGLYSYQTFKRVEHGLTTEGFPNDVLTNYQANIAASVYPSSDFSQSSLISQMLRVNYSYDGKYILTLTGRRDGYSGFGTQKKYGFFPSVAVAWNISQENWLKDSDDISMAKLRVSYGQNGNQAVGPYNTLARLSTDPLAIGSNTLPGFFPSKLESPELGWETSTTLNFGTDIYLWNGKLQVTIDQYFTNTTDLLLDREISPIHGITSVTQNIGKTKNRGTEISVTSTAVKTSNFQWNPSINLSFNKNEIVDLYGDNQDDVVNKWFIGQPIRVSYGYEYDGVYQVGEDIASSAQPDAQPGWAKIVDQNANGKINADDRVILGQSDPKFIWGFNNSLTYKNFNLYFLIHGMHGNAQPNDMLDDAVYNGVLRNTTVKNWWTPDNPTNEHWANDVDANLHKVQITQKRDFIRLKDVTLSYTLPKVRLSILSLSNVKFYVAGRNLVTFTNWFGLDPELGGQISIPLQKEYVFGVNLSF